MALRALTAALATAVAATAASLTVLVPLAAPASAAGAHVTVANQSGAAVADPTYATTLTLHGSGFQSIKGGFGGIYVLFGTVKGTWQPSKGGVSGRDYVFVPDSQTKKNKGFEKFVSFPGGDTESAANGGVLRADGTWSTTLVVPGATFTALDNDNKPTTVDCRKVTCGVITIGAHGVANGHNETFTPVRFAPMYAGSASASATPAPAASSSAAVPVAPPATSGPSVAPEAAATAAVKPEVAVDRDTAVLGHVLSFTATGFRPGEQVTASLDDGLAAVGPLTAGPSGEIAGVLQLPSGLQSGTHVLKVTGAASSLHPSVDFPISAGSTPVVSAVTGGHDPSWPPYAYLGGALVVLAGAIAFAWRRRGGRQAATGATRA